MSEEELVQLEALVAHHEDQTRKAVQALVAEVRRLREELRRERASVKVGAIYPGR